MRTQSPHSSTYYIRKCAFLLLQIHVLLLFMIRVLYMNVLFVFIVLQRLSATYDSYDLGHSVLLTKFILKYDRCISSHVVHLH